MVFCRFQVSLLQSQHMAAKKNQSKFDNDYYLGGTLGVGGALGIIFGLLIGNILFGLLMGLVLGAIISHSQTHSLQAPQKTKPRRQAASLPQTSSQTPKKKN